VAGGILLVWSALAAVAVGRSPGPNALDRWGFAALGPTTHSTLLVHISELGDPAVLAAASVLAAVVVVGRDRRRAVACLVGPAMATVLVEWVVKPAVGRHYLGVLSFPSGSVTVVASLAAAWTLAVPGWTRWPVAAVGVVLTGSMTVAVIALRWHYPSDALAGAAFGVGMVLLLDGLLHLAAAAAQDRHPARPGSMSAQ
jgi:membrane-associated phospholipid phosphatase